MIIKKSVFILPAVPGRAVRRGPAGLVPVRGVGAGGRRHRGHALRIHPQGLRAHGLHQLHLQGQVPEGQLKRVSQPVG